MWATLALTTALSLTPAQKGQLQLTNIRPTYWVLGQERKENIVLPGDIFVVSFDIENLKVQPDGVVKYSMGMELNMKGKAKPEFQKEPMPLETVNILGGSRLPSFARAVTGPDTVPGEYTLKVTVTDRAANQSQVLTQSFQVVPPRLGFVRAALTYESGQEAPALAAPGQTLLLNFAVVGFTLDKKSQPSLTVEMTIVDETGKPTLAAPITGAIREVKEEFKKLIPWQFILQLNRAGKFKIHIKTTDRLLNKSAEMDLDLNVVESK